MAINVISNPGPDASIEQRRKEARTRCKQLEDQLHTFELTVLEAEKTLQQHRVEVKNLEQGHAAFHYLHHSFEREVPLAEAHVRVAEVLVKQYPSNSAFFAYEANQLLSGFQSCVSQQAELAAQCAEDKMISQQHLQQAVTMLPAMEGRLLQARANLKATQTALSSARADLKLLQYPKPWIQRRF